MRSDYDFYSIKKDRWTQFKRNARKLGFIPIKGGQYYERTVDDETSVRIFCNSERSREIWFWVNRIGGTCYPQTVYRRIVDLIDDGYVDERSEHED